MPDWTSHSGVRFTVGEGSSLSSELCVCLYLFPVPVIKFRTCLDGQWPLIKEIFAFLYLNILHISKTMFSSCGVWTTCRLCGFVVTFFCIYINIWPKDGNDSGVTKNQLISTLRNNRYRYVNELGFLFLWCIQILFIEIMEMYLELSSTAYY